jgi:hypothetical protein
MNMNIAEIYTGMRAIPQSGSGLSILSISLGSVSSDMVLLNDIQNKKLVKRFKYGSDL